MSSSKVSRYAWGPVKTNRHKVNKVGQVNEAHLLGRLALLDLDLTDIITVFGVGPHKAIVDDINAEIKLINDEIARRARVETSVKKKRAGKVKLRLDDSLDGMDDLVNTCNDHEDAE